MPTVYTRRRFSQDHAKKLFKIALEKRPHSIHSLKQSLQINTLKYERYLHCINNSTEIFKTSFLQPQAQKEETELVAAYQKNMDKGKQAKFFKQTTWKQHKNMGKLLIRRKTSNQTQKQHQARSTSEFLKMKRPLSMIITKDKVLAFQTHKYASPLSQNRKSARNVPPTDKVQQADRFWRRVGTGRFTNAPQRSKTQSDQKSGQNTVGDLIKYCKGKQSRAANFLILQLQLNVDNTRRTRRSAGLPQ